MSHARRTGRVSLVQAMVEAQATHGWSDLDEGWITCFHLGEGCMEKGRLGWAVGKLGREEEMLFQTEAKQNKQKPRHWNSSSEGLNVRPGLETQVHCHLLTWGT